MLTDLPDLLAGCLGTQVKVFTIQGVNQCFPIHLKPERHCRVKSDLRVRRIRKFKKYLTFEYFSEPPESFSAHAMPPLTEDLQVIEGNLLTPIVGKAEAHLSFESARNLKPENLHGAIALQDCEQ